jgi:hypothetical protein
VYDLAFHPCDPSYKDEMFNECTQYGGIWISVDVPIGNKGHNVNLFHMGQYPELRIYKDYKNTNHCIFNSVSSPIQKYENRKDVKIEFQLPLGSSSLTAVRCGVKHGAPIIRGVLFDYSEIDSSILMQLGVAQVCSSKTTACQTITSLLMQKNPTWQPLMS